MINKESKLDLMWEEYISTKDASSYKNFMSIYKEVDRQFKLKFIQESYIFGNTTYEYAQYLKGFFSNNSEIKQENLKPKLSNTQKSTIGVFLADIFNLREIKKSQLLSEDINELLLYENIDRENFEELLKILDFTSLEKYDLILQKELLPFSKNEESLKACSSNVFDACYINYQNDVRKVILVSLETPIDAIFFPSSGLIITSDHLRFELSSRLKKLFQFICKDILHYSNYWTDNKDLFISHLIRDNRPYHVIADELSGYYYLQTNRENSLKLAFLQRSTFVEYDKLELDAFSYTLDELQKEGLGTLFFSSYYRLNRSDFSKNYENWLVGIAKKAYENEIDSFKGQNVWIAITGGEKRYWIEEIETIIALIKYFQKKDKNTKFIFDGYTSTEIIDDATKINIAKHVTMLENIVKKTNLKESDYISVIGAQVLKKVAYASKCSFCITSGTPAMWCSKIAKVSGVFHGNHEMMNRAFKDVCDTNSMMAIPKDKILEVGHEESAQRFKQRWDFVNYSIKPDIVLDLIKGNEDASFEMGGRDLEQMAYIAMKNKEYSQALGYWNILIDNTQKPNKDYMAEKLKCLYKLSLTEKANEFIGTIKNVFSTYRNLDHMIKSAQFFGKPEVAILEDMEGAYRIIDCNTKDNSNILFITFGKVSSRHDHLPFGYPFLVKQGYRHIHIAQYKGTQYQDLSFEEFEMFFKSIAFKYDKVFTYGSSLGAYAALYYAGAVNAKAIASDPRLPLHPMNKKFKNIIWKENSHYDEYELKHTSMSTNRLSDKESIVIYDRHDEIDSNFCENYILQVYKNAKIINIANTKHASLLKLKSEGKLKQFVIDVVEDKLDILKYENG